MEYIIFSLSSLNYFLGTIKPLYNSDTKPFRYLLTKNITLNFIIIPNVNTSQYFHIKSSNPNIIGKEITGVNKI